MNRMLSAIVVLLAISFTLATPNMCVGCEDPTGDVNLKFLDDGTPVPTGRRDDISDAYKPLPEIKHLFRQPDPRPPASVSSLFTLVVTIVPGLILIIGWLTVGINFGHMPLSPFTLGFHGGLAGILALYGMFWLRLDMFVTLKYLTLIGAVTFMCGNVMLRTMAERRIAKAAKVTKRTTAISTSKMR